MDLRKHSVGKILEVMMIFLNGWLMSLCLFEYERMFPLNSVYTHLEIALRYRLIVSTGIVRMFGVSICGYSLLSIRRFLRLGFKGCHEVRISIS